MNRKIKVTTAAAFIGMTTAAQIQQKPNIALDYGGGYGTGPGKCYGMKAVRTPNLNRMVEEGVIYRAACCTGSHKLAKPLGYDDGGASNSNQCS